MNIKKFNISNETILQSLKSSLLCLMISAYCGFFGLLFTKAISFVTNIREYNPWLIYFLPIAGVFSMFLSNVFKTRNITTNHVIKSCTGKERVNLFLAPVIFISSIISHLFGASVGREGAALQIGGGLASFVSRTFKSNEEQRQILVYCGMAGMFSAVFGTPLTATAFAIQIVSRTKIRLKAIIPSLFTSYIAYFMSVKFGAHPERFTIKFIPNFSILVLLRIISVAILAGLVGLLFCYLSEFFTKFFKKYIKNLYFRIAIGGGITIILTLIVGCKDYNGSGSNIIEDIFTFENYKPEAFILKLIFTCIASATCYRGGEIVPSLFIGATFGSLMAAAFSLPITFGAAIGMIAVFSAVTKCPIAACFLAIELFSGVGYIYLIITAIIAFFASGKLSLYSAQNTETLNINLKNIIKKEKNLAETLD